MTDPERAQEHTDGLLDFDMLTVMAQLLVQVDTQAAHCNTPGIPSAANGSVFTDDKLVYTAKLDIMNSDKRDLVSNFMDFK